LPKEFRLECTELEIFRRGDEIVPREDRGLARAFEILADLPADFLPEGRGDSPPQDPAATTADGFGPVSTVAAG